MKNTLLFTTVSVLSMGICAQAKAYELTADDLGQSANIKWEEVNAAGTEVITVHMPNGDKFFKYGYFIPNEYSKINTRIGTDLLTADVNQKTFENSVGASSSSWGNNRYQGGGVISNINQDASGVKITSDFVNNHTGESGVASSYNFVYGGAIMNYAGGNGCKALIGDITGDFIGNSVESKDSSWGGAIMNHSEGSKSLASIGNIKGDFINNHTMSSAYIGGGAISQYGVSSSKAKIGNITGDFIGNYLKSTGSGGVGGAISNFDNAEIGDINGNFIGNHVEGYDTAAAGALKHQGQLGTIYGSFIGNYIHGVTNFIEGGAIDNNGVITGIVGNFIGNYGLADKSFGEGGAIHNAGRIGDITGDFIGNYLSTEGYAWGGAIHNALSSFQKIVGNFISNHVESQAHVAVGGAINNWDYDIYNHSTFGDITGQFNKNHAVSHTYYASGGAIHNYADSAFGDGTAIFHNLNSSFTENHVSGGTYGSGGAIANNSLGGATSSIKSIIGDFTGNYALGDGYGYGGAIANYAEPKATSSIGTISGLFSDNFVKTKTNYAQGGAIFNNSEIKNIINSSFINNHVSGVTTAYNKTTGGAIYSTKDITITADNGTSEFTGNYVLANGVKSENAIYMASDSAILNLNALSAGQILFNDEIDGSEGYKIKVDGDSSGTVTFNNHIRNADITLSNTNMIVDKAEYLGDNDNLTIKSGNLTINSGEMTINQLGTNTLHFKTLAMPAGVLKIDSVTVDLENKKSGMIEADTASGGDGVIKVENILLTSDGEAGDTPVLFVSDNISDEVTTEITEAVAPVFKYDVAYDNESGEFIFTRGDKIVPDEPINPVPDWFNPGVFANDVAAMSSMNTQGEVAKQVFDMDTNREYCYGRVWATPYYSDDTLGFSNFYDVDSKNYGLIAGVDTRAFGDYDGWNSVYTLFGAYNDSENKYQGVKVDGKSWLVGLKASIYNGGFYGDAIINYAWHDSDQKTAFGTDSVDSNGYGAAIKTGYKFDMNRMSVDTSAMLSWQEVQGEDFTSKSGARISTDDYSRLTLTPQVKLGYSFEKVRPYALVRYNFVLDEDGSSTVNNIALPTIESKDYVECGLGVETTDAFPHGGYAHVLRHDGGRSGWSVTAGYRFNF